MALAVGLEQAGKTPSRISTTAACTIDKVGAGFKITSMRLEVRGKVPGIDQAGFQKAAEAAKDGCPVSQALKGNVKMELDAKLDTA
jgi:osmotically inducible protein OsmC